MKTVKVPAGFTRAISVIVAVLAIIGLAVATRRALSLAGVIKTYASPKFGTFDRGFGLHPVLTFVHIVPGGLFMILAPLQFIPNLRSRCLWFHRWSGRIIVVSGLTIGISP